MDITVINEEKNATFVIFLIMPTFKNLLAILFLIVPVSLFAQSGPPQKYEYRAVWLTTIKNLDWPSIKVLCESDIQKQKDELSGMLDSLARLNINTVFLQTRLRGDVIYPSQYEPFSAVLTGRVGAAPGYDPLAFAVEECHKRGMQLHAWLVTLPLGNRMHVKSLGRKSLPASRPSLCRMHKGDWFMEPGEPATADYLCRIVAEIVSKYNVDGIHLDYIRYPDRSSSYADTHLYRKYGKGKSLADWRRGNITRLVRSLYEQVKSIKPWVRVSVAPLGKHDNLSSYSSYGWNARNTVFQDAQAWMREGIVDALFPMLYFRGNDFYPFVRDWAEQSYGRHLAPGIGVYRLLPEEGNWEIKEIERQLTTSRSAGAQGSVMFRARHLLTSAAGASELYKRVYADKALVPPMNWCASSVPAQPDSFSAERHGDFLTLSWSSVRPANSEPAVKYNLYVSRSYPVNTADPRNIVAVALTDTVFVWEGSTLDAMHWAVVPVNAYGVEGAPAFWSEQGFVPEYYRKQFYLPEPATWGMRVVVRNAVGNKLYECGYSQTIGVRGLPKGVYTLEVLSRNGDVLLRYPFTR